MRMRILLAAMAVAVSVSGVAMAQQSGQAVQGDQYQGVSQPPNDPIMASPQTPAIAKPSAAVVAAPATPEPQPTSAGPVADPNASANYATPDVGQSAQPVLNARQAAADPDGDIVQPRAAQPGELLEGATIRVKLTERLSSSQSEKGEPFHGQVAADVVQNGIVLIPVGSAIEGRVTEASSGHFGGHGSLRLRPEAVILPDGSRYRLHAETTGTQGSKTRMGAEGAINPGSRAKKDGIEYGAVVGTGVVTGAVVAGPVGALTGGLIGAGVVTTHLMVDHPQATLEPGTILLFSLTEPMFLTQAGAQPGN